MSEKTSEPKKSSIMDGLLHQLEEQVNLYEKLIVNIKISRCSLQETTAEDKPMESITDAFQPGIFYGLSSLIEKFRSLNAKAENEASLLNEYL